MMGHLGGPHALVAGLMYGGGVRLLDAFRLREAAGSATAGARRLWAGRNASCSAAGRFTVA
jgi:hypothetical protein